MSRQLSTVYNGESHYFIGIDPDTEKSGVAVVEKETRKLECAALTFRELLDYMLWFSKRAKEFGIMAHVYVEAGWMNKSNWHLNKKEITKYAAAAIGVSQGRNEEVSRLIGEVCEYCGLPFEFVKPFRKQWNGKDGKITHEELAAFTGIMGRTNQEMRDASLIAWVRAGLSIRIKRKVKKNGKDD